MNEQEIRVQLDKWRGYSAYELAVKHGFIGTEEEWLKYLEGGLGDMTVNGKGFENGTHKIKLYLKDIPMRDSASRNAQEELDRKFDEDDLVTSETDGSKKPLSASVGKTIARVARSKARILMREVRIPAANWELDEETNVYGQSVAVDGITADTELTGAQVAPPLDRELEGVYTGCSVRASAQGDGVIVFTALDKPEVDLPAAVYVVIPGDGSSQSGEGGGGGTSTPEPGADGFSPVVEVEKIDGGHRVTITDAEGTKAFEVMDGEKGDAFTYSDFTPQQLEQLKGAPGYTPQKGKDYFDGKDGEDGEDGVSPVVETSAITGGHRVSITDKNGTKSFDVMDGEDGEAFTYDDFTAEQLAALKGPKGDTPVKGKDYFTDADKEEIAEIAAERVQIPVQSVNGKTGAVKLSAQDVGAIPSDTSIPAKTSELTNDSGFITKAVADLASYYTKSETYTRDEINQRIGAIPKFSISVVTSLPTTNISETTIYLVGGGVNGDLYTEYIRVNGAWEILGSQRVDLAGYATEAWVGNQLAGYQKTGDYALKSELPTKLSQLSGDSTHRVVTDAEKTAWNGKSNFSGNYNDLTGKPTLPTVPTMISAFQNDAGYLVIGDIAGKLDVAKLQEAINAALEQAKASGEFDGDPGKDGTSVTVSSVSESSADGGSNVVKFSDGKTVTIKNGGKGTPGYTPVRGVDYYTPADREDIVQQVISAIGTPVFGMIDADNNIILTGALAEGTYTVMYEDSEGEQTKIGTLTTDPLPVGPAYTNALKVSIGSDGQPYNGGKGWKDGYRLNSSAEESQDATADVTGFIAARWGNTLYLDGVTMSPDSSNASKAYMYMYDSSFKNMGAYFRGDTNYSSAIANGGITLDENRNVKSIVLSDKTFTTVPANIENARYVRFSCEQITDESIVTVNEPIE